MQPLSHYLASCFLLLILAVLLFNALSFLIGVLIRNTLVTTVITSGIICLIPILPNLSWLPLTYLKIDAVASNYLGYQLRQPVLLQGVISLSISIIVVLILARLVFARREKGATR